jgi:AraC-like DNA-binding protein
MYVSILVVRAFLEVVSERGLSREQFLEAAGLEAARLDDLDGHLELAELDRMQQTALALTGDPALGLHMAERATAPAYDVVGYLAAHGATLRDSIENVFRYTRILSDMTARIEEAGDVATLVFKFMGDPDAPPVRLRAELTVAGFLRLVRTFCGENARPHEALFEHAAPPYAAEYTRLFGGVERFAQPVTALRFHRTMLARESIHKNPRFHAMVTSEAERMLERLERGVTHAARVRELLASKRLGTAPSMNAVAAALGMSVRSLRRRLSEEGVSYPELLEQAQVAFAKRLLESPARSIYEVAFEMGFSDPSAFHRAFRRWTGMTPAQYRESTG